MLTLLKNYFDKKISYGSRNYGKITKFLQFVSIKKCNVILLFYLVESLSKNQKLNKSDIEKYGIFASETILKVHLMDEEIFLKEGCVTLDWERLDRYKDDYNVSSDCIKDIAPLWYRKNYSKVKETIVPLSIEIVDYTYAALLKIILIHKASGNGVSKKIRNSSNS